MTEFKELFEASLREGGDAGTGMYPGALLEAKVVEIGRDFVTLTAGLKSECGVPVSEFTNKEGNVDVNIGDVVSVVLVTIDDGYGHTELSREKAKRNEAWKRIEKVYESGEPVWGIIRERVKGGFTVDLEDIRAFLPGSLVDVRPVRDTSHLEGRDLEFKVIKMDQKRNNIVVSRRAVVEAESSVERDSLLESLEEGAEVMGVVKNLTDYGAFVDLGGIDGLLHITDLSWRRVKHPSEVLTVGQELKVKVLKFDRERSRVSLGIKQLGEDPWGDIAARYPVGTKLKGKVTNITDYGCFVEIEEGVEGLVHMSEMDWTNKNVHPSRVVQLSEEVEVKVLEIEEERRRISLGMKQCISNPWDAFAATHNKGDKVSGSIRSITDFGIFIGLDGHIDGLIHLSDISWREPGEEAVKAYKKGQDVEAVILAIDPERERISLSIKQLEEEPADAAKTYSKGSIVTGKVIEVDAKGATVELSEGVTANLRASDISDSKVDDARTALSVGDEIEAKIVNIDKKTRSIQLSIKAKDADDQAEAMKKYAKSGDDVSNTQLGDLLKAQIDTSKSE